MSDSSSRRFSGASASAVTVVEKAPRLIRPRGRRRVGRDPRNPRSRGHRNPPPRRMHPLRAAWRRISRSASIARRANRKSSARTCCSRSAAGPTPTTSGSRRRACRSTRAATSLSTTDCGRIAPHIWALGDCNGRGAFTHTSYNDFEIAAANLLDGAQRRVSDRILGYALYIDPPLGRVGLTEAEARAKGHSGPDRRSADDPRRPRGRERRNARLHEGRGRPRRPTRSSARRSWAWAATRRSIA